MDNPKNPIEKTIDELDNGKANLRVHLVVPPGGDNPWRTQSDYEQEQKEARERHALFQEQHQLMMKSFHMNRVAVAAALFAAIAAGVSAYYARQGSLATNKQVPKQQIEDQIKSAEPVKK